MALDIDVATTPWLWQYPPSAEQLCAQAERAEAMGLHSFWLPENHFGQKGAIPAPLMLLAAVAARTTTLKLGCTSYLLPVRDPLLAAEEVAVLDNLSEGRLILGLGRGIQPAMFEAFGIDPGNKRRLFRDKLEVMRRAWRGEDIAVSESGAGISLSPLPRQSPEPPLWVAAFGPLALKQVAGLGLPYLASPLETLDELADNYDAFHGHVSDAGNAPVTTVPVMRSVFVSDMPAELDAARDALRASLPPAYRDRDEAIEARAIVGEPGSVRDTLAAYCERLQLTHLIVRAGLPGMDEAPQVRSLELLLDIVRGA